MFSQGDYVVKTGSGICIVEGETLMSAPGSSEKKKYYILVPKNDGRTQLFVPTDNADRFIRPVMTESEALTFMKKLPEYDMDWIENNRQRDRCFKETIKSYDPVQLAGMLHHLYIRRVERTKAGRKIPSAEDRFFNQAESCLFSELALALGKKQDEIGEMIRLTINECIDN